MLEGCYVIFLMRNWLFWIELDDFKRIFFVVVWRRKRVKENKLDIKRLRLYFFICRR